MAEGPSPCSRERSRREAIAPADVLDRRGHDRHPAAGRLRIWVLETLGFAEGSLVDISRAGVRFRPAGPVPHRCLMVGDQRRIELYGERGNSFGAMAEIRHVGRDAIGLEVVEPVPVELFRADLPAPDESAPNHVRW